MTKAIHLLKLAAGIKTKQDFLDRHEEALRLASTSGFPGSTLIITRNRPKREAELLSGGSVYWIYSGSIHCRQRVLEIIDMETGGGARQCLLRLHGNLQWVSPAPRRAFQGWRYLEPSEAPKDGAEGDGTEEMPEELVRELTALGLL